MWPLPYRMRRSRLKGRDKHECRESRPSRGNRARLAALAVAYFFLFSLASRPSRSSSPLRASPRLLRPPRFSSRPPPPSQATQPLRSSPRPLRPPPRCPPTANRRTLRIAAANKDSLGNSAGRADRETSGLSGHTEIPALRDEQNDRAD